jgi:hypothetical protein
MEVLKYSCIQFVSVPKNGDGNNGKMKMKTFQVNLIIMKTPRAKLKFRHS